MKNSTRRTILRKTQTYDVVSFTESQYNLYKFAGLNDSENYTTVDQYSFADANNVYVDGEDRLTTRPAMKQTTQLDSIVIQPFSVDDITDIQHTNNQTFYIVNNKDVYWKYDNRWWSISYTSAFDYIKIFNYDSYYLIFTQTGDTIDLRAAKYIFDNDTFEYYDADDLIYVPLSEVYYGGTSNTAVETNNILTDKHRIEYIFNINITTPTENLVDSDVVVTIGDKTYKLTWSNDLIFRMCKYIGDAKTARTEFADFDHIKQNDLGIYFAWFDSPTANNAYAAYSIDGVVWGKISYPDNFDVTVPNIFTYTDTGYTVWLYNYVIENHYTEERKIGNPTTKIYYIVLSLPARDYTIWNNLDIDLFMNAETYGGARPFVNSSGVISSGYYMYYTHKVGISDNIDFDIAKTLAIHAAEDGEFVLTFYTAVNAYSFNQSIGLDNGWTIPDVTESSNINVTDIPVMALIIGNEYSITSADIYYDADTIFLWPYGVGQIYSLGSRERTIIHYQPTNSNMSIILYGKYSTDTGYYKTSDEIGTYWNLSSVDMDGVTVTRVQTAMRLIGYTNYVTSPYTGTHTVTSLFSFDNISANANVRLYEITSDRDGVFILYISIIKAITYRLYAATMDIFSNIESLRCDDTITTSGESTEVHYHTMYINAGETIYVTIETSGLDIDTFSIYDIGYEMLYGGKPTSSLSANAIILDDNLKPYMQLITDSNGLFQSILNPIYLRTESEEDGEEDGEEDSEELVYDYLIETKNIFKSNTIAGVFNILSLRHHNEIIEEYGIDLSMKDTDILSLFKSTSALELDNDYYNYMYLLTATTFTLTDSDATGVAHLFKSVSSANWPKQPLFCKIIGDVQDSIVISDISFLVGCYDSVLSNIYDDSLTDCYILTTFYWYTDNMLYDLLSNNKTDPFLQDTIFGTIVYPISVTTDGYITFANNDGEIYSNYFTDDWYADITYNGDSHIIIPSYIDNFITHTFVYDNVLYQMNNKDMDDGYGLLYIPEDSKVIFPDKITGTVVFSQTSLALFTQNTAYEYTYDSENDVYRLYPTKLQLGNREDYDMCVAFDGLTIYLATVFGYKSLTYEDFIQSTEQAFTDCCKDIYSIYTKFDDSPIKQCKYNYWIFLYKQNSKEVLVYDTRYDYTNYYDMQYPKWFKWTLAYCPVRMWYEGTTFFIWCDNNKLYTMDFTSNDVRDVSDGYDIPIEWFIKSQRLHFSQPAYYKHINALTILTAQASDMRYNLQLLNYHNDYDTDYSDTADYKIETVGVCVKKVNFMKTQSFQYIISNDPTDDFPKKFTISGITIKYRVTERVR